MNLSNSGKILAVKNLIILSSFTVNREKVIHEQFSTLKPDKTIGK